LTVQDRGFPGFLKRLEVSRAVIHEPLDGSAVAREWGRIASSVQRMGGSGPVTLVVNDSTRPPSGPMITSLEDILDRETRIIVATGTHRPVSEDEKEALLGGCFSGSAWKNSDCDSDGMVHIGTTSRGTPVGFDPWILDGGPVIAVNSVEPHYFAGFTGGRKSFLPGVASRSAIVANHYLACLPGSQPGKLEGNPVHEDMNEALSMLEQRVGILQGNGVMHGGKLVGFFAGTCTESFESAAGLSSEIARLPVPRAVDVLVLHPGEPLHMNLYQSEKALYNCSGMVSEGGWMLLVSSCPEGLGADHLRRAFISSRDPGWRAPDRESYRLGDHAIVRLREMRERLSIALASGLPDGTVREMGMEPVDDVEVWLGRFEGSSMSFIPSAGFVVPCIEES